MMASGNSAESRPRYWSFNSSVDREELRREIERCLESDEPPECSAPLPPIDPFGEWWDSLPDDTRRKLQARAEDFRSFDEFFYGYVAKGMDFGPVGATAREWINRNLEGLFADEKRMRGDPEYARRRIKRFLQNSKGYLNRAFGIATVAHRKVENLDRDRAWSKQNYLGRTYLQIATDNKVDEPEVRTAIHRHRKRREALTRYIGWVILESAAPINGSR